MSQRKIRTIYESHLASWAAARVPPLRVAYENVVFDPANGETYLRCFLLPAATQSETLEGEHRAFLGVFQVSIVSPIEVGAGAAQGIAAELDAVFVNFDQMTASGVTVQQISPVSIAPAIPGEKDYTVPASFSYRADTI